MIRLNDKAIAVEVLKGAIPCGLSKYGVYYKVDMSDEDYPFSKPIPYGDWQILGLAHELSETQCVDVVDVFHGLGRFIFFDYLEELPNGFETAKESFRSLMESHGLVFENPHGTIEPDYEDDNGKQSFRSEFLQNEWKEAQQKVKTYLILTR